MKKIIGKLTAVLACLSASAVTAFAAPASANPLTGDDFNMKLCITVMAVCVVGIAALLVVLLIAQSKLKKQRNQAAEAEEEADAPEETEEAEATEETEEVEVTEETEASDPQ